MIPYIALLIASGAFLVLGYLASRRVRVVSDFLPVSREQGTRVRSLRDFSASTVATTVSLATIVAAYFNLVGHFGLWLLWTAFTGAAGMLLAALFAGRISDKLSQYRFRPSLHEFLACEYSLDALRRAAATFTIIGILLLLATEFIVGSSFLAQLIPGASRWVLTIGIAAVAVAYVMLGGFDTVIRTDRIQMLIIWWMIPAIAAAVVIVHAGSVDSILARATRDNTLRQLDAGLVWFLVGVALMNIPTHLSSMILFQRVSGSANRDITQGGLKRSAVGVLFTWGLLVLVAWLATIVVTGASGAEVFGNMLARLGESTVGNALAFLILMGLYCALLSTASAFLVAVGHTLATDIRAKSARPLGLQRVRLTILASTVIACGLVIVLQQLEFQIEDMIFSIYGGALSLFPPILIALLRDRVKLARLGPAALAAIVVGFIGGWGIALYGKLAGIQNLVFLSPTIGMVLSALVLGCGMTMEHLSAGARSK
ncbi:MAG: hypothetical protein AABX23_03960 [Nanoarchaeota archaeon]